MANFPDFPNLYILLLRNFQVLCTKPNRLLNELPHYLTPYCPPKKLTSDLMSHVFLPS